MGEALGNAANHLKRVSEAIHGRFEEEPVLPWWAIQYMLCEVGPLSRRMDPRELMAIMNQLANRTRPARGIPHGPWQPRRGIYVTPRITLRNARHNATIAAATKEDQLLELAARHAENRVKALGHIVASVIEGDVIEETDSGATEHLGGGARWSRAGVRLVSGVRDSTIVCVWVTNDLRWIFPDDPRLWRHLDYCLERDCQPVILARKIAISTFPLLKRLGAFGVQLHHLYLQDSSDGAWQQALAGAPPILVPADAAEQVGVQETLVNALNRNWKHGKEAAEGVRMGVKLDLHSGDGRGVRGLREWLEHASIEMPVPWKAQLTRYERWLRSQSSP